MATKTLPAAPTADARTTAPATSGKPGTEPPPAVPTTGNKQPSHAATAGSRIAKDLRHSILSLRRVSAELGTGDMGDPEELAAVVECVVVALARAGALADRLAASGDGIPVQGDAADWNGCGATRFYVETERAMLQALQPVS